MINNCLLRNKQLCSRRLLIKEYKRTKKVLIVYGYDWGTRTDTPALIYDFIKQKIKPFAEKHNIHVEFERLRAKEGSIGCDICYLIQKADIGLFDVSTNNINVIFELGLAIGSGVYVFMLHSRHRPKPKKSLSDLSGILEIRFTRRGGVLKFDNDLENKIEKKLLKTIELRKKLDILRK